jgi:hypothetical protein
MGLDPGEDDLRPALAAKLMQPLAERRVSETREFDLVGDEAGIGDGLADGIDGRAQALRVLLRKRDRHLECPRRAHEPHAALDNAALAGDRADELVLDIDDEELRFVAGEQHGPSVRGFAGVS